MLRVSLVVFELRRILLLLVQQSKETIRAVVIKVFSLHLANHLTIINALLTILHFLLWEKFGLPIPSVAAILINSFITTIAETLPAIVAYDFVAAFSPGDSHHTRRALLCRMVNFLYTKKFIDQFTLTVSLVVIEVR
nr:hypothetical protein Iba_chr15fCG1680 [Ipomoea batatas]